VTEDEIRMAVRTAVNEELKKVQEESTEKAERVLPWIKGLVMGAFALGVWLTGVTNQINNIASDVTRHEAELRVLNSDGQVVKQDIAVMKEILIRVDKGLESLSKP